MFQNQRNMIKNGQKLLKIDKFRPNIYFNVPKTAKYDRKTKIWYKNSEKLLKIDKFWSMFQKQRNMIVKPKYDLKTVKNPLKNYKFRPNIYFNVPKTAKNDRKNQNMV